ncbi:MAG: NCS2 family permease [Candidatus Hydrogenedentes bacterium]|nr:NCS2 family permease [Candidatus Hydrogenedentota bacterium]
MNEMFDRLFDLKSAGTTVRREVLAGLTTFATMSYIVFVQPTVLSQCGMDFGGVLLATCISAEIACLVMGLYARYPIALAPGMGENFYFALVVCGPVAAGGLGYSWQTALAAVFVSGVLFLILSFFGFRERIVDAIPHSLKCGIAAGIGLFIAMIGFEWSGLVVDRPGVLVGLGNLASPPVLLSLASLAVTAVLLVARVRGAILFGILFGFAVGLATGVVQWHGIVGLPKIHEPVMFRLDFSRVFGSAGIIGAIFIFFFLDLFDTVGTLIGVAEQGGLIVDGRLPRARQAFAADALGTTIGSLLGTSTITSYVESAAGVSAGGRTGLTAVVAGLLFLVAPLFSPIAQSVGEGYALDTGAVLYPVVAPALIIVGFMMAQNARKIEWDDYVCSIPYSRKSDTTCEL